MVITSPGAPKKPYIKRVTVNGRELTSPILTHTDIANGGHISFEMSGSPQSWASGTLVRPFSESYGSFLLQEMLT